MNGFGTTYYGEDASPDGSLVTTEWLIVAFLPVLPLRSFRLARTPAGDENLVVYRSESYAVLERLRLRWLQVARVYAFVGFAAAWWASVSWLWFFQWQVFSKPFDRYLVFVFLLLMVVPFIAVLGMRRVVLYLRKRRWVAQGGTGPSHPG